MGHQLNDAPMMDTSTQVLPAEYKTTISRQFFSWIACKLRAKPTGVYDSCKVYSLFGVRSSADIVVESGRTYKQDRPHHA
jgi:hypothetical protein